MIARWPTLSLHQAAMISQHWEKEYASFPDTFSIARSKMDGSMSELSDRIGIAFDEVYESCDGKYGYDFDFDFGLKLYSILGEYGFGESDASNDDVWRYLQMRACPDLIVRRWPFVDGIPNEKRSWKNGQRMYFKAMWWYIHILWDGSLEQTEKRKAQIDISQITDRSGYGGIRIDVYKKIMHRFAEADEDMRRGKEGAIMILNSSYCRIMEPGLGDMSLDEYVDMLFRELGIQ